MSRFDARHSTSLEHALADLGDTQSVSEFLDSIPALSVALKTTIVDQAMVLVGELYAHLPLKEARHAVNPVQRLRLLCQRLGAVSDVSFHNEMLDIFKRFRDAHTNYVLPRPFRGSVAFLPFIVEAYHEAGQRHFLVTRTLFGFSHSRFKPGVEVTHWNGRTMEHAVRLHADREEGSNDAARFAFGLASLTVRSLGSMLPPDEEWVTVTFRDDGDSHEIVLPWRVWDTVTDARPDLSGMTDLDTGAMTTEQLALSLNTRVMETHSARKFLFARATAQAAERTGSTRAALRRAGKALGDVDLSDVDVTAVEVGAESILPEVFQFGIYQLDGREYGYLRIRTFGHSPVSQFVNEFLRILDLMPTDGLILDVRGNGGGIIWNGELLLQFLTPREVTPEPFHFISTPLTGRLCTPAGGGLSDDVVARRADLASNWGASIARSVETGAVFSNGVPLTPPDLANRFGQRYHGPVALVTDAMCYSTTDMFAAGFKDHAIGTIIGVDANTGAGGANVWEHEQDLVPLLPATRSPFRSLPAGTSMRVAIRRSTRVGRHAGQPLEDLGVKPHVEHPMTRADLLEGNIDLITRAVTHLSAQASYVLDATVVSGTGDDVAVTVTTRNLDRLDCYINDRPTLTADIADGANALFVPLEGQTIEALTLNGFAAGEHVAARKLRFA